jgi:hypothetical protein
MYAIKIVGVDFIKFLSETITIIKPINIVTKPIIFKR